MHWSVSPCVCVCLCVVICVDCDEALHWPLAMAPPLLLLPAPPTHPLTQVFACFHWPLPLSHPPSFDSTQPPHPSAPGCTPAVRLCPNSLPLSSLHSLSDSQRSNWYRIDCLVHRCVSSKSVSYIYFVQMSISGKGDKGKET